MIMKKEQQQAAEVEILPSSVLCSCPPDFHAFLFCCWLQVHLKSFFTGIEVSSLENVSLSLAHSHKQLSASEPVHVRPMEIEALKVGLK